MRNERFVNANDGTISDRLTELMWPVDANIPKEGMAWQDAANFIAEELNTETHLGYSDWRLPSIKELLSLIDFNTFRPALPVGYPFTDVEDNHYWSSSLYVATPFVGSTRNAWIIDMASGRINIDVRSNINYIWPVRGTVAVGLTDIVSNQSDPRGRQYLRVPIRSW